MKLSELKTWIESLPAELQEKLDVVVSREGTLDEEHTYRLDAPIIQLSVDEENNEANIFIENDREVKLDEDGGAPAGAATVDATPGMGAPQYANRGEEGSGDVPSGPAKRTKKKKSKKKKIKTFWDFIQQRS